MLKLLKTQKFISLLHSLLAAVAGAFIIGLLARALSTEDLGLWVFYMTVYTFVDLLRAGIMSNALIRLIAASKTHERFKNLIGSTWALSTLVSLAGSLIFCFVFLSFYWVKGDIVYLYFCGLSVFMLMFTIPSSVVGWVSQAKLYFVRVMITKLWPQFVLLIGAVIIYTYGFSLDEVIFLAVISSFASAVFSIFSGWSYIKYAFHYSKSCMNEIFTFGKYSMGTMMVSSLFTASDVFLLQIFLGAPAVALYNIPQRLVSMISTPLSALVSVAFPNLARDYAHLPKEEFIKEFEKTLGFTFLILMPLSILAFVFAEPLVVLLGGEEYRSSALYLQIFAVYTLLNPFDRFGGMALDILNRPKKNLIKVVWMLVINVVGDIVAILIFGEIYWVAIVSIFTFSGGIILSFEYVKDIIPFRIKKITKSGFIEIYRLVNKYGLQRFK